MKLTILATSMLSIFAVSAAQAVDFQPLTAPATLANTNESTNPFLLPQGWTQTFVTDRNTLSTYKGTDGSTFPSTFGNWDMVDVSPNGRYVYIPMEVQTGAGVIRYDRSNANWTPLMVGNNTGVFESKPANWSAKNDDFGAFDPAVLSPTGSLLVAEEWSGKGRIFEVSNPDTAYGTANAKVEWLNNIPSVSHEGIKFDETGNMYFVDESNTGSIYRYTPKTAGDYSQGKTSVLVANDFAGDVTKNFNDVANDGQSRTGDSSWVDITDMDGNAITAANPFYFEGRGGRAAADEVNGTPYGRPEDMEVNTLENGEEVLYWATTSENIVYGLNLTTGKIFEAVNSEVTPDTIGNTPVGQGSADDTYGLDDPDNLAFGPDGMMFIIEDENPGDVWAATDVDGDGTFETVELFASLGPFGSEPTGFIYDEWSEGFLVAIQHPSSQNDALWLIQKSVAAVPVPAAVWMFGSALIGLVGVGRRRAK